MVKIKWTIQAIEDVDNIAEFIAKDSLKYAQIQVHLFFDRVQVLETQPRLGRHVPEIVEDDIRELVQGSYRIIYRIVTDMHIDILTVHHSRRLLRNNPAFK